jgi:biotin carboxylase
MKALVLAGGLPQIALIEELHRRGISTVLCDYYENPVAKPFADVFYQVSTLDVPAVRKVAVDEQVDFLITVCTDQALLTVAQISEELGLPCYISYKTARDVTNKSYMKQIFAEKNISSARFSVMGQLVMEQIKDLRYPLIVKPVDCNSSKGVQKVTCEAELAPAFETAVRLSRTKTAIVEEFIVGPELSVDVYVENGEAHILSVSELDKLPLQDKFIIFRAKSPKEMTRTLLDHIKLTAQQIADAFGLENAPMLIQMISDGQRCYVLEFSARTGGGEKYIMIPKVSGFDPVKAVVDLTLGEKPKVPTKRPEKNLFATEFIYCNNGIFHHMESFDTLKDQGVLAEYYCFHSPGTEFDQIASSGDRVGGLSIVAQTAEQLQTLHEIALRELKVIDSQGADMMRRDLLPDLD